MVSERAIEVVAINDHLTFFYWGRHPAHNMLDMRLGGGTFAIHRGDAAIVVDTMTLPGQGAWVREHPTHWFGWFHRRFRPHLDSEA